MSLDLKRGSLRQLTRIRTRLLLINLLIVAVPIVGIGFARTYERELLRDLEDDMVHQAQVLRAVLLSENSEIQLVGRSAMLAEIARHTRSRIRLLDARGRVVADSHRLGPPEGREPEPPQLIPNLSSSSERAPHSGPPDPVDATSRVEVQRALAGHYGARTRLWENGNRLFLFSALPIERDGVVEGVVYVTRSTNPVRAAMYRLRTSLIIVLLVAMAGTLILSLFLAGTISRPLSRLTRIAGHIAGGDRTQRLALRRHDEIGELARAIDSMARKLDARAQDVAELAANLSHEFKSPLTSIRGAAELLIEGAADDPEARARFLQNILADAGRLDRLVTRLLELSRLEADTTAREALDYETLVREAAQRSGPLEVRVDYLATRRFVQARRPQLVSVLSNLLDNAQQHASVDSVVTVRISDGPRRSLRTAVHNLGSTISDANLERVWSRFFTTRGDQGGTGLGLPIVKAVVEAHGGTVHVSSDAVEGTTFCFELP